MQGKQGLQTDADRSQNMLDALKQMMRFCLTDAHILNAAISAWFGKSKGCSKH